MPHLNNLRVQLTPAHLGHLWLFQNIYIEVKGEPPNKRNVEVEEVFFLEE